MIDVMKQQVLSIVEQAVPWWAPMITKAESAMLERVLKTCLHILLGDEYKTLKNALKIMSLDSLSLRRKKLFSKFSASSFKNPRYKKWFCDNVSDPKKPNTRNQKPHIKLKPVTTRTNIYARSSISVMTSLLSWHPPLCYKSPELY